MGDDERVAADSFAAQYRTLRRREGWVGPDGREDPDRGDPRLWRDRLRAVSIAAAAISRMKAGRPVVVDVGSGGGWAARHLGDARVIAIDLLAVDNLPGVLTVRGDMRRLPIRDGSVDVAFYAASIHYAPVEDSIREASRVLRHGGLLIAIDSPMYPDARAQAQARQRSTTYYAHAGFPELAAHYHPIDVAALRAALAEARFEVQVLDAGRTRWMRRASILIARYP